VLGKTFHCKGVLDKLIFIPITVCSYNRLFSMTSQGSLLHSFGQKNKAKDNALFNSPILLQTTSYFPIMQHADDTLIIMKGDARQLFFLN